MGGVQWGQVTPGPAVAKQGRHLDHAGEGQLRQKVRTDQTSKASALSPKGPRARTCFL